MWCSSTASPWLAMWARSRSNCCSMVCAWACRLVETRAYRATRIKYLLLRGERSLGCLAIGCPLQQVLIGLIPSVLRGAALSRLTSDAPGAPAVHRSLLRGQFHGFGETLCAHATAVATNLRAP